MTPAPSDRSSVAAPKVQWPTLVLAIAIMLVATAYPPLMVDAHGKADHNVALALFWSMSAGFVRGVGYVPRHRVARWLLGAPAAWATFALALLLKGLA